MNLRLLLISVILVIAFSQAPPAAAHGEARLEVSPERLSPGASLTIRGVDFSYDHELRLALRGPDSELPLGTVIADAEGGFLLTVMLPADLQQGTYKVHAVGVDIEVTSPAITIQGLPVSGEDEGGRGGVGEEDGLVAPMPTYPPGFSSTPLPAGETTSKPSINNYRLIIGLVGLAAIALVFFLFRMARSR